MPLCIARLLYGVVVSHRSAGDWLVPVSRNLFHRRVPNYKLDTLTKRNFDCATGINAARSLQSWVTYRCHSKNICERITHLAALISMRKWKQCIPHSKKYASGSAYFREICLLYTVYRTLHVEYHNIICVMFINFELKFNIL